MPETAEQDEAGARERERLAATVRSNASLLVVMAVGTGAGIGIGVATGRPNWPVYLVVILVGGALVVRIHRRYHLSAATRVGLVVFGLGHVAGGMVPVGDGVLYGVWIVEPVVRYDNLQHAWGFGFAGRATWEVLRGRLGAARDDPGVAVWLIVLGAAALGAVNEVVEWVLTLTIPGTDVGGYDNTARDLVANLAGGVVVASVTVGVRRRSRPGSPARSHAPRPRA